MDRFKWMLLMIVFCLFTIVGSDDQAEARTGSYSSGGRSGSYPTSVDAGGGSFSSPTFHHTPSNTHFHNSSSISQHSTKGSGKMTMFDIIILLFILIFIIFPLIVDLLERRW